MLVRRVTGSGTWSVFSSDLGATQYLGLFDDAALSAGTRWNSTAPTSSVFTVSGSGTHINRSGETYLALLFASLAGVSKIGTYSGTGSNVGVDCGFTAGARFVLIKRTDGTGDWHLFDSTRGIVGGDDPFLLLGSTAAQDTDDDYIDPLNSGFTVTSSAPAALNASGGTYLFLAIA